MPDYQHHNADIVDFLFPVFKAAFGTDIDEEQLNALFNDVITHYQEPHRAYHTLEHLADLTAEFTKHEALFPDHDEKQAILIALFYHDIVYECVPKQDEIDSAEYMEETLKDIIDDKTLIRAKDIILYTASHAAPDGDYSAQLFLDMDMAILASTSKRYDIYTQQVAEEFCTMHHLSHQDFVTARAARFLEPTLNGNTPIFKTDEYKHLENTARENMTRELRASYINTTPTFQL